MTMLTVKPADGRRVLQENGEWFGTDWAEVESTAYLRRRLADGDLEQRTERKGKALVRTQEKSEGNKNE